MDKNADQIQFYFSEKISIYGSDFPGWSDGRSKTEI